MSRSTITLDTHKRASPKVVIDFDLLMSLFDLTCNEMDTQ